MADLILRERLATQIVAVMQADFSGPGPDEMREILRCAEGQTRGITPPYPRDDAPSLVDRKRFFQGDQRVTLGQ